MPRRYRNLFRRKFKPPSQPTEYVVYYDPKREIDIFGNPVHNLSASTRQLLDNLNDPDRSYHNFSLPLQRTQIDPANNILKRSIRVPNTSIYVPPPGDLKMWPNRTLHSGNYILNTGFVTSNEQLSSYLEPFADPPTRWRNVKFHPKEQRADSYERYLIDNLLNESSPRQFHNGSLPTEANENFLNKSFWIPQTSRQNGHQLNQTQWVDMSTINRQFGSPSRSRNSVGNRVLLNRSLPAVPIWPDQIEDYDEYENEMYSDDDFDDEYDQLLDEFCNISMNDLQQPEYQDYEDDEAYQSPSPLLYSIADDAIVHKYPRVIPYGRVIRHIPIWRFTYRM